MRTLRSSSRLQFQGPALPNFTSCSPCHSKPPVNNLRLPPLDPSGSSCRSSLRKSIRINLSPLALESPTPSLHPNFSLKPSPSLSLSPSPSQPSSSKSRHSTRLHVRAHTTTPSMTPSNQPTNGTPPRGARSLDVAVIGAGAAGLAAARELKREGHKVTVYEQDPDLGGVWRYNPKQEDDPVGVREKRREIHSSMYASLRTNLPRELMSFTDFPFSHPLPSSSSTDEIKNLAGKQNRDKGEEESDPRRFPGHEEVLRYLRRFAQRYDLEKYIKYNTKVLDVRILRSQEKDEGEGAWPRYAITTSKRKSDGDGDLTAEDSMEIECRDFDALLVCNGHYSQPRLAHINGIDTWPGQQMHSHNYRHPDDFKGKVVVLIGAASSGDDLSKEISRVAESVHMTSRGWNLSNTPKDMSDKWPNLQYHPMVTEAHEDGTIEFGDGARVRADVVFYCTGYKFFFPFLSNMSERVLSVEMNRVGPLYQHLFPPALAPTLSLVGLPWKVVPFPLVELQSKWVAKLLSGTARNPLPTEGEMLADVADLYAELASKGVPQDYTHCLSLPDMSRGDQFTYDDWLAQQCDYPSMPSWRKDMYEVTSKRKRSIPWAYRDTWDDQDLIKLAHDEFQQHQGVLVRASESA